MRPRSLTTDSPSPEMYSAIQLTSAEKYITKIISYTSEPAEPLPPLGVSRALATSIICIFLSDRNLHVHRIRSPSLYLTFIPLIITVTFTIVSFVGGMFIDYAACCNRLLPTDPCIISICLNGEIPWLEKLNCYCKMADCCYTAIPLDAKLTKSAFPILPG
jgi:hypothetical protein